MAFVAPLTLEGRHVRLEPLQAAHHDDLCEAVRDGELWNHWYTAIPTPEGMAAEIERGIEETIITSLGSEGASSSAQLSALSKTDRLAVIMEVYQEGNSPRSLSSVLDRSLYSSPV